jgi:CBS domain-containing protein
MPASASIVEAAQRMRDNSIGNILVEKDGKVRGLITGRDIVVRGVAEGKDPRSTDLEFICSKEVVTLSPDQSEEDATH